MLPEVLALIRGKKLALDLSPCRIDDTSKLAIANSSIGTGMILW